MILVVDDRPENIFSLKSILEIHGFQTDAAESGEEALKKVLKTDYSLIILDVQMPGMDGFEVAEALIGFTKTKDIPIIFLSAINKDKSFITKGYTSGGIDYVTKPIDTDILLLKVKTFHRLSEQKQQLAQIHKDLQKEIEIRKQAEAQLEQKVQNRTQELVSKNKELEAINLELQQFTWIASHDLKEPLRKIQTFSYLIKDNIQNDKEKIISYLNGTIKSAERMADLINDLLDYSRLSTPTLFKPTSLNKIIRQVIADLEHIIKQKKAQVNVGSIPKIDTLQTQIRQVFQNLISNGLKFSKTDETPVINITAELVSEKNIDSAKDAKGTFCRIVVSDNGIGFHEKYLEKIFIIFQRLHDSLTFEGTGIGLAIAKKIIEKHNGLISAKSTINKGSSFIIILPLHQDGAKH